MSRNNRDDLGMKGTTQGQPEGIPSDLGMMGTTQR